MKNRPFENFDFTDFWDDDEYAMNEYIGAPPTEEMIEETERELGYKLPRILYLADEAAERWNTFQCLFSLRRAYQLGGRSCGYHRHYGS